MPAKSTLFLVPSPGLGVSTRFNPKPEPRCVRFVGSFSLCLFFFHGLLFLWLGLIQYALPVIELLQNFGHGKFAVCFLLVSWWHIFNSV